jgi:hypothetical protein
MDDAPSLQKAVDVGIQTDFNLVLFSGLSSTFSLGYALGVQPSERAVREFTISLKLL